MCSELECLRRCIASCQVRIRIIYTTVLLTFLAVWVTAASALSGPRPWPTGNCHRRTSSTAQSAFSRMVHTTGPNGRYRQLTKLPMRTHRFRGACVDPPSDAEVYETKLRDGDIVILWVRHLHASAVYHILRFAHPGVTDRRLVRQRLPV